MNNIMYGEEDRDRLTRVEVNFKHLEDRVESLRNNITDKMEDMKYNIDDRIDDLKKRLENLEKSLDCLKRTIYIALGIFSAVTWFIQIIIETTRR